MSGTGLGQYDLEYRKCPCFWGESPGKFVNLLGKYLLSGHALDLGAGEGKNSIYLAERGLMVEAVECSGPAIDNFKRVLARNNQATRDRISIIQADVRSYFPRESFNAVIAYGLLHCLPSKTDAYSVIDFMKAHTLGGGYNVIVTFTPRIPVPEVQPYLKPTLIEASDLLERYENWSVLAVEEEVIQEMHPTSLAPHSHSLCRLLAQSD